MKLTTHEALSTRGKVLASYLIACRTRREAETLAVELRRQGHQAGIIKENECAHPYIVFDERNIIDT